MKVFIINRKVGDYSWCDNYKAVIVAEDALSAERKARIEISGWKKAKLEKPIEITLDKEQILSVENAGA